MISKFRPAGHLILIFIKRILTPPRTISVLQGVSQFSKECSSAVYTKSALDLVRQFSLKMMLGGDMLEWGDKKILGRDLTWMP